MGGKDLGILKKRGDTATRFAPPPPSLETSSFLLSPLSLIQSSLGKQDAAF